MFIGTFTKSFTTSHDTHPSQQHQQLEPWSEANAICQICMLKNACGRMRNRRGKPQGQLKHTVRSCTIVAKGHESLTSHGESGIYMYLRASTSISAYPPSFTEPPHYTTRRSPLCGPDPCHGTHRQSPPLFAASLRQSKRRDSSSPAWLSARGPVGFHLASMQRDMQMLDRALSSCGNSHLIKRGGGENDLEQTEAAPWKSHHPLRPLVPVEHSVSNDGVALDCLGEMVTSKMGRADGNPVAGEGLEQVAAISEGHRREVCRESMDIRPVWSHECSASSGFSCLSCQSEVPWVSGWYSNAEGIDLS